MIYDFYTAHLDRKLAASFYLPARLALLRKVLLIYQRFAAPQRQQVRVGRAASQRLAIERTNEGERETYYYIYQSVSL